MDFKCVTCISKQYTSVYRMFFPILMFTALFSNIFSIVMQPTSARSSDCRRATFWDTFQNSERFTQKFWDYEIFRDVQVGDTNAEIYDIYCNFSFPESFAVFILSCNDNECRMTVSGRVQSELIFDVPRFSAFVNNCYYLSNFSISNNNIPLRSESHILELHMESNEIIMLPEKYFDNISRLERLHLYDNGFMNPEDMGFNMDCQNNSIVNSSVIYLDLSLNSLTSIQNNTFCKFTKLTALHLSSNNIATIDPDAFKFLKSLEVLDLSYNDLKTLPVEVFQSQTHLFNLDVTANPSLKGKIFSSLKPLHKLKGLHMTSNGVSSLKNEYFIGLKSLTAFYLARNDIKSLDGDFFRLVLNMEVLDLSENQIETISNMTFQPLINLTKLNLNANNIKSFANGTFTNNSRLENLYISGNHLVHFPDLGMLSNLNELTVSQNRIENITMGDHNSLCNLFNLKQLDLSKNRIGQISPGVFDCIHNLENLNLKGNIITQITGVFSNSKIESLNLWGNYIQRLSYADISTDISELDVGCNEISHFSGQFTEPLNNMSLTKLNCANNQLTKVYHLSFPMMHYFYLDLSYNQLNFISFGKPVTRTNSVRVNLRHNAFDSLCAPLMYTAMGRSVKFQTEENPLKCACEAEFLNYQLSGAVALTIPPPDSVCPATLLHSIKNTTSIYNGTFVGNVTAFSCTKTSRKSMCQCNTLAAYHSSCGLPCPDYCACFLSNDFSTQLINCTGNRLKDIPESLVPKLSIILAFSFNELESLTNTTLMSYINAKGVYLDHNLISSIEAGALHHLLHLEILHLENNLLTQLPAGVFHPGCNLFEVDLSHNYLRYLEVDAFDSLKKLTSLNLSNNSLTDFPVWKLDNITGSNTVLTLSLRNNPWNCDCNYIEQFRFFLQHTRTIVEDVNQLYCSSNETNLEENLLLTFNSTYCYAATAPIYFLAHIASWSSALVSLLVIVLLSVLLFVYRKELQVWIYSRYGLRIFHRNTDTKETEMVYDAFIAHSSYDEELVMTKLIPGLEGIANPYHLCFHQRDFLAGPMITESIMEAVERSHRTIVVMSDHFVNSEWCRFEFKNAYLKTLSDRCNRLIVIILDKIPNNLESEMSLYMKTNTYLKWGERFFWEKLYFALPDKTSAGNQHVQMESSI